MHCTSLHTGLFFTLSALGRDVELSYGCSNSICEPLQIFSERSAMSDSRLDGPSMHAEDKMI